MFKRTKSILFVIGVVIIFTAQTNRPDDKGKGQQQHAPAAKRAAPAVRTAPHNQARPQVQNHPQAQNRVVQRSLPRVNINIPQPLVERRATSQVYAVRPSAPVANNRLFHRQHHKNWQPLYNFYNDQYQFYPYVNVTSPVELSADCVSILFNGQTYYYDQGAFYLQDPQGYLAAPPPIGIIVSVLPPHAREINVGGQIYYRYKGIFYVQVAQGYQVVGPVQSDNS